MHRACCGVSDPVPKLVGEAGFAGHQAIAAQQLGKLCLCRLVLPDALVDQLVIDRFGALEPQHPIHADGAEVGCAMAGCHMHWPAEPVLHQGRSLVPAVGDHDPGDAGDVQAAPAGRCRCRGRCPVAKRWRLWMQPRPFRPRPNGPACTKWPKPPPPAGASGWQTVPVDAVWKRSLCMPWALCTQAWHRRGRRPRRDCAPPQAADCVADWLLPLRTLASINCGNDGRIVVGDEVVQRKRGRLTSDIHGTDTATAERPLQQAHRQPSRRRPGRPEHAVLWWVS